ncbi:MAG: serine/threonine-protein kinase [Planctomycetota bacterium]
MAPESYDPSQDPWLDKTIDGYHIECRLGHGGMASIYRGTQLSLGRTVAIKVLPPIFEAEYQFRERFKREADVLARLQHPNVVTLLHRGEEDGRLFLAMEFVRGESLRERIDAGPLSTERALRVTRDVLSALEHVHEAGIVHRDVKPANVMVTPEKLVKIVDFGLGFESGPEDMTRLTHTRMTLGTREYMAPEQREKSKSADARSDLYSTGVVLYEMLTGELPIGWFALPSQARSDHFDKSIDTIIERSLQKNPARRYASAAEMGAAVTRALG